MNFAWCEPARRTNAMKTRASPSVIWLEHRSPSATVVSLNPSIVASSGAAWTLAGANRNSPMSVMPPPVLQSAMHQARRLLCAIAASLRRGLWIVLSLVNASASAGVNRKDRMNAMPTPVRLYAMHQGRPPRFDTVANRSVRIVRTLGNVSTSVGVNPTARPNVMPIRAAQSAI